MFFLKIYIYIYIFFFWGGEDEISNNLPKDLLGTNVYKTFEFC